MAIPKYNKSDIYQVENITLPKKKPFRRSSLFTANNLQSSFKFAYQGLSYCFKSQRNFRIHVFLGLLVSFVSICLNLSITHLAIILIAITAVLVLELINTSIESLVDLSIGRQFNPLARIAKDCAAASVFVASISAVLIAILLILPPLIKQLAL